MSFSFIPTQAASDSIADFLFKTIKVLIIGLVFLLPLIWMQPVSFLLLPLKTLFLGVVISLIVVLGSLGLLRQARIDLSLYAPIIIWWGIVAIATISALFSPSYTNALIGFSMSIHTVAFIAMLGVLMTVMTIFRESKQWSLFAIAALILPVLILSFVHIARFIFGYNFLTFGVLQNPTDTLVGSWNDLAILSTFTVGVLMVTLVQLPLPKIPQMVIIFFVSLLLSVLAVINFSVLWYGLGLFGLVMLLYTLTRDRVVAGSEKPPITAVILMTVVSVVSTLFIIAGATISGYLGSALNTSHIEVRPSLNSTLDIARQSLHQNLLLGVGPNHFTDAWKQFRDVSINETLFWNVDFLAAHSYVTTWFITTGILGILAWLLFLVFFFYSGARILLLGSATDRFWFYVATSSFLIASVVWLTSLLYVPGVIVLVYGAVATGLLFASARPLGVPPLVSLKVVADQRSSIIFIIATLIMIISSITFGYFATKQFSATYTYASVFSIPAGENRIELAIERISSAHSLFPRDVFLREIVDLRLVQIYSVLSPESPSESEQRLFELAVTSAIETAGKSVRSFPRNPENWLSLGKVYLALSRIGVEGASERAIASFREAILRDPINPLYHLQIAVALTTANDISGARTAIADALKLKTNYFDAYVLLSELEILSGNSDDAIQATRSLISLEPRNSGLYYRLGILQLANGNLSESVSAFTDALRFDSQFANARYVRALVYAEQGNPALAISELETVRSLNEGNEVVSEVIAVIRENRPNFSAFELITPVQEPRPSVQQDTVLSTEEVDASLFSPVNTPPPSIDTNARDNESE
jgi:tetratricopeptide (TPR) repeat protein